MVSCEILSGGQQNPLIGLYLPRTTLDQLHGFEEAINKFLGRDYIIIGHLNKDIVRLHNLWIQQVAYFLARFGLVDLLSNFMQRMCFRHMKILWEVQ